MEVVQQVNINKQINSSILSSNLKLGKKGCIIKYFTWKEAL
jgi:hypothetical protein